MEKEEFIKQRCEIDDITEEEFESTYRVIECNCGKLYCKGYRCLDLDDLYTELRKQKEINNKAIDFIIHGDLLYLTNKNSIVYKDNVEIKAVADRLNELLEILEDKEEK